MNPDPRLARGPAAVLHLLRDVLMREPALAEDVRKARSPAAAAEALARIGALRGIATDAAELRTYVTRLVASQLSRPLPDEALDDVAGGTASEKGWAALLTALLFTDDRPG